jgi:hypothetical protein
MACHTSLPLSPAIRRGVNFGKASRCSPAERRLEPLCCCQQASWLFDHFGSLLLNFAGSSWWSHSWFRQGQSRAHVSGEGAIRSRGGGAVYRGLRIRPGPRQALGSPLWGWEHFAAASPQTTRLLVGTTDLPSCESSQTAIEARTASTGAPPPKS